MVDINLMGEQENREVRRQPEESFAQTVNLDLGETADDEKIETFPAEREPAPGTYSREAAMAGSAYSSRPSAINAANAGSSRNKAYLLVAALILAALVAVYLMLPKSRTAGDITDTTETVPATGTDLATDTGTGTDPGVETDPNMTASIDSSAMAMTPPATETMTPDPSTTATTTEPMPSAFGASGMFASTKIGAYTVGALGQAFGGDNDFSVISYSGTNNSFLVQFSASSSAAVSEVTQAMQRNASPEDLRTVSNGSSLNSVVVLGRVGQRAAMMAPQSGSRRLSLSELGAWLKKLAADNGLRVRLYDPGKAYAGAGGARTPVRANFSGDKAGVFEFLKNLADAGPNLSMSKIVVSPSDRRSQSSAKLEVALLFEFVE